MKKILMRFLELCKDHPPVKYASERKYDLGKLLELGIGYCEDEVYQKILNEFGKAAVAEAGLTNKNRFSFVNKVVFPRKDGYFSVKPSRVSLKGQPKQPFIIEGDGPLLLCEGESDALALHHLYPSYKIMALCGVSNQSWLSRIDSQEVIFCFDNDSAGRDAQIESIQKLPGKVIKAQQLYFPEEFKDIDEFWRSFSEDKRSSLELIDLKIPEQKKETGFGKDGGDNAVELGGVREGKRAITAFKQACRYRAKNLQEEEIFRMLQSWNQANQPPLPEAELKSIIKSTQKYTKSFAAENFLHHVVSKKSGEILRSIVRVDAVVDFLEDKFEFQTVSGLKDDFLYVYEDGVWSPTGKGFVQHEVELLLKNHAKNSVVNEVTSKLKRRTIVSRDSFEEISKDKFPVNNGVLTISKEAVIFEAHRPEYNFKSKIPVCYNPKQQCKKIQAFFEDTILPGDLLQVQEFFGLLLTPNYPFKKAALIHGPPDSGKSVFLNILQEFLGRRNISGLSLQRISFGKPFDLLSLKSRFANIYDDLSSKGLNDGGGIKMAIGDSSVTGEMKFGDHVTFRNSAKMIFACNKIPVVKDVDDSAYYKRWLIWSFENEVSEDEKDPDLIKTLSSPEELSGLLNWAILGLQRLLKENKFTNELDPSEVRKIMERSGNPLAHFAKVCLVKSGGSTISKEEMYQFYGFWCGSQEPKVSPKSKTQLGRNLSKHAPYLGEGHGKERYWKNVKFNTALEVCKEFYKSQNKLDTLDTSKNNIKNISGSKKSVKKIIYNFSETVESVDKISSGKELWAFLDKLGHNVAIEDLFEQCEFSRIQFDQQLSKYLMKSQDWTDKTRPGWLVRI